MNKLCTLVSAQDCLSNTYFTALTVNTLLLQLDSIQLENPYKHHTNSTKVESIEDNTLQQTWRHTQSHQTLEERLTSYCKSQHNSSLTFITYSAEVLLVFTDSLHLRSVQDWHIVRHGLLSILFVLFLLDQSTNSRN